MTSKTLKITTPHGIEPAAEELDRAAYSEEARR